MRSCVCAHVCFCVHVRVSVRVRTMVHAGLWAQRLMLQREKSSFTAHDSGHHSMLPLTLCVFTASALRCAHTREWICAHGCVRHGAARGAMHCTYEYICVQDYDTHLALHVVLAVTNYRVQLLHALEVGLLIHSGRMVHHLWCISIHINSGCKVHEHAALSTLCMDVPGMRECIHLCMMHCSWRS